MTHVYRIVDAPSELTAPKAPARPAVVPFPGRQER